MEVKQAIVPSHRSIDASPAETASSEVTALARGLMLLRVLSDAGKPLGNAELSSATGIPKATVSRLVATLTAGGHLRQEPESERYWLGPALLELGNLYLRRFDLRGLVRTHFAPLADATGCSLHLGIRDRTDILIIESVRPRSAVIASQLDIGSRMAIWSSAAGRAHFAAAGEDERSDVLGSLAPGERRRLGRRLIEGLAGDGRRGFSVSFGEWHSQINAIACALRGPRGELYAISCGGPAHLLSQAYLELDVAPRLLLARDDVSRQMGLRV